ncbi:LOW QUALITY PROTEIN: hypothetical protein RSAG8_03633, partial [Rhizoctonia solani AG-8 WAC10335]
MSKTTQHEPPKSSIVTSIAYSTATQWVVILTLIFGGCCSNALALEYTASYNPHAGSLITFTQFLLVAAVGLRHRLYAAPIQPRNWVSLVAVHIIFRSGGLVVNLLLGLALGKKYTPNQILSVLLVTAGVALSTASSLSHKRPKHKPDGDFHTTSFTQDHLIGLSLLTLALVLSGLMGLAQERTYAKFGRHWQEGMFYLHFLALPMFALPGIGGDLVQQIKIANASPPVTIIGQVQNLVGSPVFRPAGPLGARPDGFIDQILERIMAFPLFAITLPSFYVPLAVNVFTQFLCVGGVHRLTSQVSSLTVTLVLVVRKAVSLWISVVLVGGNGGDVWLWGGAMAVVVGTFLYSLDQRPKDKIKEKEL